MEENAAAVFLVVPGIRQRAVHVELDVALAFHVLGIALSISHS